jgi:predicted nucleic acid-binding protein
VRVLDACTVINLLRGGVFDLCIERRPGPYFIGTYVLDELGPDRESILRHIRETGIEFVDGSDIPANLFLLLIQKYDLGDGETEAISIAVRYGYTVCTDDRAARAAAVAEMGNVMGSLGILRELVHAGAIPASEAFAAYQLMVSGGAFLPDIDATFFQAPS